MAVWGKPRERDWWKAVVLSTTIRLGCWPVVAEDRNSRTPFSGGTAESSRRLNIVTGSGGTSAGVCQSSVGGPVSQLRWWGVGFESGGLGACAENRKSGYTKRSLCLN